MSHHLCQHDGCDDVGYACYLDEDLLSDPAKATEFLCPRHAVESGYCYGCGRFFAGIEEFDFGSGLCSDCKVEFDDGEPDEEYEEDYL